MEPVVNPDNFCEGVTDDETAVPPPLEYVGPVNEQGGDEYEMEEGEIPDSQPRTECPYGMALSSDEDEGEGQSNEGQPIVESSIQNPNLELGSPSFIEDDKGFADSSWEISMASDPIQSCK